MVPTIGNRVRWNPPEGSPEKPMYGTVHSVDWLIKPHFSIECDDGIIITCAPREWPQYTVLEG